jgi:tetratricopeptide (TPR) repeat protein
VENSYKILGLKIGATINEVEKAYNKLLIEFDPEKQSDDYLKEFFKSEQDKVKEAYNNILEHLETKPAKIKREVTKKNSSTSIKVLARALLIGVVIFLGYLFINNNSKKNKADDYVYYYNSAKEYQADELYQSAINDYNKCINIYSDRDSIIAFKAQCYYEKGAYKVAIENFTKAIDMVYKHPNHNYYSTVISTYLAGRGKSYSKLRKHSDALSDFDKALEIKPDNAEYHLLKGNDLFIQGKYNFAERDYTKSLSLKKSAVAYYKRGNANYKLGKLADAISDYTYSIETTSAFKSDKDYAKAYRNRGIARYESCKTGACEDLKKAYDLDDTEARTEYLRITLSGECE